MDFDIKRHIGQVGSTLYSRWGVTPDEEKPRFRFNSKVFVVLGGILLMGLGIWGFFWLHIMLDRIDGLEQRIGRQDELIRQFGTGDLPVEKVGEGQFRKIIPWILDLGKRIEQELSTSSVDTSTFKP